jgi:hypothetical protein
MDLSLGTRYDAPAEAGEDWFAEAGRWVLGSKLYPAWLRVYLIGGDETHRVDGVLESVDELPLEMGQGNYALSLAPAPNEESLQAIPCRDIAGIMLLPEDDLDRSDELRGGT